VDTTTLLMGFHCHQPVGNFHSVLRRACTDCYGPLLEELALFPGFRFGLHMSGYLLEWIEREEKGIYSLIGELAGRGQAELLTAGFYEPILSVIPPEDALEQINLLSDLLEDLSGIRPAGLWLTERIWDPGLVPLLNEAGIRYTMVDDNHLLAAGHSRDSLSGYFITETLGRVMGLYPISQQLRYATPFKPVNEALAVITSAGEKGRAAVVFDDGEKFGMWPGTRDWVYGKGWLRDFLKAVTGSEDIRTDSFTGFMEGRVPLGRLHLAAGSYFEMGEWTLTAEDARLFHKLYLDLERSGKVDSARRFLRGGVWPDFLIKYPESNNMHKKMIRLSERTRKHSNPDARRSLLRAQCNDAYWHGIFGGLYLPVLRNALKRELIDAERKLDNETGISGPVLDDLNSDGFQEAELKSPDGVVVVTGVGGQVFELSDRKSLFDLLSTLARRVEHYHLPDIPEGGGDEQEVATIHEAMRSMDEEVRRNLVFDRYARYSFVDHFLPAGTDISALADGTFQQLGDFADGVYQLALEKGKVKACRKGWLFPGSENRVPFKVEKVFTLEGGTLKVQYEFTGGSRSLHDVLYTCELNLHFPSGVGCKADLDGRPFPLGEFASARHGMRLAISDPVLGRPVTVGLSHPAEVRGYPVHSVSQSEEGFDVTYQGSCLCLGWTLDFSGSERVSLELILTF
jgi:hypothetical protein